MNRYFKQVDVIDTTNRCNRRYFKQVDVIDTTNRCNRLIDKTK